MGPFDFLVRHPLINIAPWWIRQNEIKSLLRRLHDLNHESLTVLQRMPDEMFHRATFIGG